MMEQRGNKPKTSAHNHQRQGNPKRIRGGPDRRKWVPLFAGVEYNCLVQSQVREKDKRHRPERDGCQLTTALGTEQPGGYDPAHDSKDQNCSLGNGGSDIWWSPVAPRSGMARLRDWASWHRVGKAQRRLPVSRLHRLSILSFFCPEHLGLEHLQLSQRQR